MVCDVHFIFDSSYHVGTDVFAVVEGLQTAPYSRPVVFGEFGFGWSGVVDVHRGGIGVDPLLDFDCASAVIDFVGYIRGLGGDVTNLADEGDLLFHLL